MADFVQFSEASANFYFWKGDWELGYVALDFEIFPNFLLF